MKRSERVMNYDDACPMCAVYTKAFINTGLLLNDGRQSFSNVDADLLSHIDPVVSKHEIPLINLNNNTILYGINAMPDVLGSKLSFVKQSAHRHFQVYAMQLI